VLTNDTDLVEPVRIVTQELNLPVTLLTPTARPAASLIKVATHVRHIQPYIGPCQLPNPVLVPGKAADCETDRVVRLTETTEPESERMDFGKRRRSKQRERREGGLSVTDTIDKDAMLLEFNREFETLHFELLIANSQ
jgi:hypothetical protein